MAVRGRSRQTAQQRMPPSLCSNLSDLPGVLSPALKRFLAGPSGSAKHSSLVDSASSDPDTELPVSSAILLPSVGMPFVLIETDGTSCSIHVTQPPSNGVAQRGPRGFSWPVMDTPALRKVFPSPLPSYSWGGSGPVAWRAHAAAARLMVACVREQ